MLNLQIFEGLNGIPCYYRAVKFNRIHINHYIKEGYKYEKISLDVFFILIGAFIFALAINLFVIPNELGEGGVTGITIILFYLLNGHQGC